MKKFFSPEPAVFTTGGGGPGLFHDTIHNMKNSLSLGSDVIRTNVAATKDKKIILFSNAVYQNKQLAEQGFGSYTLEELKNLFLSSAGNQPGDSTREDLRGLFPDIEEALSALKQHRFNFHFPERDPLMLNEFCGIITNHNAADRILVSTLTSRTLKAIKGLMPGIATAFSFGGIVRLYALHRSGLMYFRKSFKDDALITYEMIGASFVCNAGLIKEVREKGVRVYALNVMKEDEVRRLDEAGVNGFVTNYASMVKRSLPPKGDTHAS